MYLCEVAIKWEVQRAKEEAETTSVNTISILRKDQILATFKPLQKSIAIATCMNSTNSKVIRSVPTEPTNSAEARSSCPSEMTLPTPKNPQAMASSLFGALIMLKAACINKTWSRTDLP